MWNPFAHFSFKLRFISTVPHIGHVYTVVLADALSRWQRLHGKTVTFTTGTDEHGLKVSLHLRTLRSVGLQLIDNALIGVPSNVKVSSSA